MKKLYFLCSPKLSGVRQRSIRHWEVDGYEATLLCKGFPKIKLDNPLDDQSIVKQFRENLNDKIKNKEDWKLYSSPLSVNQYYPRIFRPVYMPPFGSKDFFGRNQSSTSSFPMDKFSIESAGFQLSSLVSSMNRVFSVLHPSHENFNSYGVEIRNLLMIACTEFEAQCKAILVANNYNIERTSTRDYVKIKSVLRLSHYSVQVSPFSEIPHIEPFKSWDAENPTKTLPWYDAYNKTKHNREREFSTATLEAAITAVGACAIMAYAQFGKLPPDATGGAGWFRIRNKPKWQSLKSYTQVGLSNVEWEPVDFPF